MMKRCMNLRILKLNSKSVSKIQYLQIASIHQNYFKVKNNYSPFTNIIRYKNTNASISLPDVIANELEDEKENEGIDIELDDYKKDILKTFEIIEEKGIGLVKLTRKYNDEDIEIYFNCQDIKDNGNGVVEADSDINDIDNEDEEYNDNSNSNGVFFKVKITKNDSKVVFHCIAGDTLEIELIKYISNDLTKNGESIKNIFNGPFFSTLEESLQGAFYEYLNERLIDDELTDFIRQYSLDKEQREYINWLENFQTFSS